MRRNLLPYRLNALAWTTLGEVSHLVTQPVKVTATDDRTELVIAVRPLGGAVLESPVRVPAALPGPDRIDLLLSPKEQAIVRVIGTNTLMVKAVARRLGEQTESGEAPVQLRVLLTNLKERGILEKADDGLRVSEKARPLLLQYLPEELRDTLTQAKEE